MQYLFILKDNNQKAYNGFTWFLFFLHFVAAAWVALKTTNDNIKLSMYVLLGFYTVCTIFYFLFKKQNKALEVFNLIMVLLYANFWFTQIGLVALLIFVLINIFVFVIKDKKTTVQFSKEGLHVNRIFKIVFYSWHKMDNVILKDGLLTIDFISNKLIQSEIVKTDEVVDEDLFNRFCVTQLQNKV